MDDAAGYTIRILERPDAETGGDYFVTSFEHSLKDMIAIYRKATGASHPRKHCRSRKDSDGREEKRIKTKLLAIHWIRLRAVCFERNTAEGHRPQES